MKILFKNARILKMDDSPIVSGDLLVENNRIAEISSSISNANVDQVIECNGNLLMPGFKNAHAHGGMTFLRSKADNSNLQDWLFFEVFPREEKLTPEYVYKCSKLAFLEYIKGGITAAFEQYFFPLATAEAAQDMGFRVGLVGTYNATTSKEDLINLYHKYNDDPESLVTYMIGLHAEYTSKQEEIDLLSEVCHTLKAPMYAHISETQKEVDECIEKRGMTATEYLDKNGLFDYGGGGYHCNFLTDNDIEIFKKRNLSIVTNAGSNCKLASGICPVSRYLRRGVNVAIGTDGPASNNSLNFFKEMTLVSFLSKLRTMTARSITGYEILKMATVNGSKAMFLKDCDTLNVGQKADIIMIDLQNPSMQPINNIIENLVYSGSRDCVIMTMINGKILYKDGKFLINDDINKIYKDVQEITETIDREIGK